MCQSSVAQQEAGVNVRKSKRSDLEMKKNVFFVLVFFFLARFLLIVRAPFFSTALLHIQVVASSHLALLTRLATEQLYKNISFVRTSRMVSWSITREREREKKKVRYCFWEGGNSRKKRERKWVGRVFAVEHLLNCDHCGHR